MQKHEKPHGQTTEHSIKNRPLIDAWIGITERELARQVGRSLRDLEEAMYLHDIENLSEWKDVIRVCRTLGFRCNQVRSPHDNPIPSPAASLRQQNTGILIPKRGKLFAPRPPVVTIMGHVDHGKTTLLDQLRRSEIVKSEHGGITQHIGAFVVSLDDPMAVKRAAKSSPALPPAPSSITSLIKSNKIKNLVTFLDTPGHAAFHAMRQRGAHVTDIVVLVVAAEDGIMNQTIESIQFARDAKVPIVVAINKIDRVNMRDPRALDHVRNGLFSQGIILEEDGGDTQVVKMSALEGIGISELKEAVIALAETLDLKSATDGDVIANVIESSVHPQRGRLATLLVRSGTLKRGDVIVSTSDQTLSWAKVRAMFNEFGQTLDQVTPGFPAQVIGWKDNLIPDAGDQMVGMESEKKGREYITFKQHIKMQQKALLDTEQGAKRYEHLRQEYQEHLKNKKVTAGENTRARYYRHMVSVEYTRVHREETEEEKRKINIILKCDVNGSLEVLTDVLSRYPNDREAVKVDLIHSGIGPVNDGDLELASIFKNTLIYTFNIGTPVEIERQARDSDILIKPHKVIYHLVDDLKSEIDLRLPEVDQEVVIGEAEVQQEFMISDRGNKKVPVAGVRCVKGYLKKGDKYFYRLIKPARADQMIDQMPLHSMRHLKDEVESVKKDQECGLMFDLKSIKSSYPDLKFDPGDKIICYAINKVKQKTKWTPDGF